MGLMEVELLHISECPSWVEAESRLREALTRIGASDSTVRVVKIVDAAQAAALNFAGSPTFLVAGVDLFADAARASDLACRIYRTPAGFAGMPTTEQIADALVAQR